MTTLRPVKVLDYDCDTYRHQLDCQHIEYTEPRTLEDVDPRHDNAWMYEYTSTYTGNTVYVLEESGMTAGDAYGTTAWLFDSPVNPEDACRLLDNYKAARDRERRIENEMRTLQRYPEEDWTYSGLTDTSSDEYYEAVRRLQNSKKIAAQDIAAGDNIVIPFDDRGIVTVQEREDKTHEKSGRKFVRLTFEEAVHGALLPVDCEVWRMNGKGGELDLRYYLSVVWNASEYAFQGKEAFRTGTYGIKTVDGEQYDLRPEAGWTGKHAEHLRYAKGYFESALRDLEKTKDVVKDGLWTEIVRVNQYLREIAEYLPAAEAAEKVENQERWKEFQEAFGIEE